MAIFTKEFIKHVLDFEGGYQSDPTDKANYNSLGQLVGTNHGISAICMEQYLKKPPSKDVMLSVTSELSTKILKTMFWDVIKGDYIQNQSVAEYICDWFWGSGYKGVKWVQGAMFYGLKMALKVDCKLETFEVDLINKYPNQEQLFNFLVREHIAYIDYIVSRSMTEYIDCIVKKYKKVPTKREVYLNTYQKYQVGWTRRANAIKFQKQ